MFTWSMINPELADESGLVAVGGDLQPARLLDAYRRGIFPWYAEGDPICWWSPDPRAVFDLDDFHISRRLRRTIRSGRFSFTINQDFSGVILGCAERGEDGTWLMPEMIGAYVRLHMLGHAHSVEVWHQGVLAGGVYGVAIGAFFAGESMFYRVSDASKAALFFLVEHLKQRGYSLFDIQMLTDHTSRLGAREIARTEYLQRLKKALGCLASF